MESPLKFLIFVKSKERQQTILNVIQSEISFMFMFRQKKNSRIHFMNEVKDYTRS